MWYQWLILGLILAGTCAVCWILYGNKGGTTRCIGCGKCLADGQCILQKREFPVDNLPKKDIISLFKWKTAVRKSALRNRPSERGDGGSPLSMP